jgi:hypothetical protein
MLYKFKSKNTGDVIMLEPHGRQVLEIIGKEAGPKGIILPEQMPAALLALRAAIAAEELLEPQQQLAQNAEQKSQSPAIALRHRALPFMQMLDACHRQGDSVVWGV